MKLLDCNYVLSNLQKFIKRELDSVDTGLIEGHLLCCENCCDRYGEKLDMEYAHIEVPSPEQFVRMDMRREKFGFIWEIKKMLEGEMGKIRDLIKNATLIPLLEPEFCLGDGTDEENEVKAEILDENYNPSGERVLLKIKGANHYPRINLKKEFKALFFTDDPRVENRILSLTWNLEEKITFTKVFQKIESNLFMASFYQKEDVFSNPGLIHLNDMEFYIWSGDI